jgi:PIN domain nuclease of toxin-antitoxin system
MHAVRVLLDTHAFLWFVLDDARLSAKAKAVIVVPMDEVDVSHATCWEIAIKISLQKYQLNEPYAVFMGRE